MSRLLRAPRDRGSVLPLVVGLVVVVLGLVAVVTDAGALWLRRREVQADVDAAALAGAQAVDLAALYAGGAVGDLALDPARVRRAVRSHAAAAGWAAAGVRLQSVRVTGSRVTVRAGSVVALPFTSWATGRGVTVVAEAEAVLRVAG